MTLEEMEKERVEIVKTSKIYVLFYILLSALFWVLIFYIYISFADFLLGKEIEKPNFVLLGIVSVCYILTYASDRKEFLNKRMHKYYKKNSKFKRLKSEIIDNVLFNIDRNLKYDCNKFLSYNEFIFGELYDSKVRKFTYEYSGEDLIHSIVDGVNITICDINFRSKNYRDKDGIYFQGIFFKADFMKKIKGKIFIIDKEYIKNHPINTINPKKFGERALMDNIEFAKKFDVFTDDQILARYALTPKFMQDFLYLKSIFKCPVSACIKGARIFIYIARGSDSFELDLRRPLNGENSPLLQYETQIKSVLQIVQTLNLNDKLFI